MKKFSKFGVAAVLVASLTSSVVASGFIGVEATNNFSSKIKLKASDGIGSISETFSSNQSGFGIKGGYDFGYSRIYTNLGINLKVDDNKNDSGEIYTTKWNSYDLTLGFELTPNIANNFRALVGVFGGVSMADISFEDYYTQNDRANIKFGDSGFIYGFKLGGIFDINKNNAIDFGFKFDQVSYSKLTYEDCTAGVCDYIKIEPERTNIGVFLGYNYKF